MERTLARLAAEIVERNRGAGNIALIGIRTRGAPLAHRLAKLISSLEGGKNIPVGILDITLYRDDYLISRKTPKVRATEIPFDIQDRAVVLVDDVLYTGRTVRAAIDAVLDYGRPDRIQLAVLVDRGGREMPVAGDFVGKKLVTSPGEEVRVHLEEVDGRDEVIIVELSSESA
ncbi:MAG: bifunctional pyr operon transcriptional regulator/uracil phosphoribosyltransferase PyrR [Calditrichaeota bacterium]|nr:bifunctional pyr operon transcriptional regulator/uracil phosphoribosyltransferase PyrR [Calditrichota bacterium]